MKTIVYDVLISAKKNVEVLPTFGFVYDTEKYKGIEFDNPNYEDNFNIETLDSVNGKLHYKVTVKVDSDKVQGKLVVADDNENEFHARVKIVDAYASEGKVSIQGTRVFVIKNPYDADRRFKIKDGMRKKAFVKRMAAAKAAKKVRLAAQIA